MPPNDAETRRLRVAALFAVAVGVYGIAARELVARSGFARPLPISNNAFFRLFVLHEASFLWAVALAGGLAWLIASLHREHEQPAWVARVMSAAARVPAWAIALAVLVAAAAGGATILHGVGLSMDEFAASFQARIFASGRLQAEVPAEWRGLAPWMAPVFVNYKPVAGVWVGSYLPVYAAIRAGFSLVRAEWLTNPALAAASVLLVAAIVGQISTGVRRARLTAFALLFLLLSAQFLVTSMTGYSMPAHLCLNLLWLWLYLRNDAMSLAAMPWVGVLALGLHNPVPHALFAAPFVVRVLRDRRFAWGAYFGIVYVAGGLGWYEWLRFVHTDVGGAAAVTGGVAGAAGFGGGVLHTFALPSLFRWFVQGMSLSLFFSWQTPAVAVFLPIALMAWRRLGSVERDLAVGLLGTWFFYAFFDADQGHGWGYRYMYAVLGNAVLLAAFGADEAWRAGREALVGRLVLASALATVVVQWPLRAAQTEAFVRPYAAAHEYIATRPTSVVAVDPASAWYARDFVRNDPFLSSTPKVVGLGVIGGRRPDPKDLPASVRGRGQQLTEKDLIPLGVPVFVHSRP